MSSQHTSRPSTMKGSSQYKAKSTIKGNQHRIHKQNAQRGSSKKFTKNDRLQVMQDTLGQSASIIESTAGASESSHFHDRQLSALLSAEGPGHATTVKFVLGDTLAVTRGVMNEHEDVAVLNMASDTSVAGARRGLLPCGPTQEDALCLSSTLYVTLDRQRAVYPWIRHGCDQDKCAGIYSPGVVIFKGSAGEEYVDLEVSQRRVVGVISIAAPRNVRMLPDGEGKTDPKREELGEKIRMMARIAASNGKSVLVLGAMGCGKFNCDANVVSKIFHDVLKKEPEFRGWFQRITFAIYTQPTLDVFQKVWNAEECGNGSD